MKLKMAVYLILSIFTLSFIAPFTQTTIAAEKPKPEQKENDTLDDIKTGVKVNAGMIGNIAGFSNLMLEIEQGNAGSKAAITLNAALLTAGFAKVFDDASGGQQNRSKVFDYSGYFGDAGELLGKSIDASGAIGSSYSNLQSKGLVSQTGNLGSKFWQSTKYGFTKFTGGVRDAFGTVGFKETTRTAWNSTKSQVKSVPVLNKILAPLAVVGAWIDFSDAISLSKKPEKDKLGITEKVLSGISNVLVVAGLLAAGTAGAPILAVAALVTGAAALTIKYWDPISKGAKKGWNYISKKVSSGAKAIAKGAKAAGSYIKAKGSALGNKAKDAWKLGISKAKDFGSKAKKAINKGIGKAKAFGAKAGAAIKNATSKAYQFMKDKAGQAKKGLSKAAKTISAATKKALDKAKSAASKAKKTITSAVKKTVSKGVKVISNAKKTISSAIKKTASKASKTLSTAAKKISSKAKSAVSKVTKPLSAAKKTITTAAKKVTKKAHSYTKKVTKSVSSASKKAYSYAKKATSTVKKAASKPVSYAKKAVTSVKSATKSTYSYAKKAASTVKKTVSKSVSSYGKKVSSAVKSTASKSYSYASKTASSAKKAVKSVASSAKKTVSSVAKGVTSFFKKPKFRW